jgi:uncharacterized membrane protein YsdA (DUF1294 family)
MYINYILAVLALINLAGFIVVAADKHKARKRQWRIPEATIFLIAALGGCIGVYSAMLIFRHKTRHWYFMVGIPFIFAVQIMIAYFIYKGI